MAYISAGSCRLDLVQSEWDEEKDPEGFRLGGTAPVAKAAAASGEDNAAGQLL